MGKELLPENIYQLGFETDCTICAGMREENEFVQYLDWLSE